MKLTSRTYADTLVIMPAGRLDHDNCDEFRAGLQPHVDGGARDGHGIVLDLSGLEYISSAGLRCFMLAAREARNQGGRVLLAALRPVVAEIFQISRFNMLFEIHPSVRDALASVSPAAAAAFDQG
ncbi:MAG TPA: STAS domain-containing protein [Burkholderiales bacterium]|jgi:anti-anti-sigma factor